MIKIENLEEKKNIMNTLWYNNYIIDLEKRDLKHFNELMKKYDLFKTQDNYIIVFEYESPCINKDLWFDDEQPLPELTEELFINYNMRQLNTIKEKNGLKTFMYNPYYKSENPFNCVRCSQNGYSYAVTENTFIRHLTDEEEKVILALDDEVSEKYLQRLKNYYKRYKDKIYVRGYWVNR
ncbi:MAG: hypothetical protein IJN13_00395 [Bacilli bacterium]|nr:hypothetical protein [Bacilli bacterium]